jgi:nicotinamidase-related amidase
MNELPIPDFYEPANAERWHYRPDETSLLEAAHAWRRRHGIRPSAEDQEHTHLLLVDLQKDFCLPDGSLYVGGRSGRGAMEDSDRIARFLYRNLHRITDVTTTLDSHLPFQIFFSSFWLTDDGRPAAPHREVTTADVREGKVRPNPDVAHWLSKGDYDWLCRQVEFYCDELEKNGKYRLYLWPPHCLLGSAGHGLVGVIQEVRLFHAYARGAQSWVEVKGEHVLTENYSALSPEVLKRYDGRPLAQRNTRLIEALLSADRVLVAGQAASHCVKSTLEDLLREIEGRDPGLAGKIYVLEDCMSSVAVPDSGSPGSFVFDFTDEAERALECFAAAGMHVVRSTDAMDSWPEMAPAAVRAGRP